MEQIKRGNTVTMGIRGKWRAPDWSRGMVDPPEYCGNKIKFIEGKCDIVLGPIWVIVERKAERTFRLAFRWEATEEAVGLYFPWEDDRVKARPGINLTVRDGLDWRNACGYINAIRLGMWKARSTRLY